MRRGGGGGAASRRRPLLSWLLLVSSVGGFEGCLLVGFFGPAWGRGGRSVGFFSGRCLRLFRAARSGSSQAAAYVCSGETNRAPPCLARSALRPRPGAAAAAAARAQPCSGAAFAALRAHTSAPPARHSVFWKYLVEVRGWEGGRGWGGAPCLMFHVLGRAGFVGSPWALATYLTAAWRTMCARAVGSSTGSGRFRPLRQETMPWSQAQERYPWAS
jgi:hypothetical protein